MKTITITNNREKASNGQIKEITSLFSITKDVNGIVKIRAMFGDYESFEIVLSQEEFKVFTKKILDITKN